MSARSYVSGAGEVEIQSTIGLTLGNRRRIVSGSIPHGEIQQLLDMISDIRGIDINGDLFVSAPAGSGAPERSSLVDALGRATWYDPQARGPKFG